MEKRSNGQVVGAEWRGEGSCLCFGKAVPQLRTSKCSRSPLYRRNGSDASRECNKYPFSECQRMCRPERHVPMEGHTHTETLTSGWPSRDQRENSSPPDPCYTGRSVADELLREHLAPSTSSFRAHRRDCWYSKWSLGLAESKQAGNHEIQAALPVLVFKISQLDTGSVDIK